MSESISVELLPWLPRLIDRDERQRTILAYEYRPGETIQQFLLRVANDYPKLLEMLWDAERQELKTPVEVAVNGSVLGIHHRLDSPIEPGDQVLLLPQYQGG